MDIYGVCFFSVIWSEGENLFSSIYRKMLWYNKLHLIVKWSAKQSYTNMNKIASFLSCFDTVELIPHSLEAILYSSYT